MFNFFKRKIAERKHKQYLYDKELLRWASKPIGKLEEELNPFIVREKDFPGKFANNSITDAKIRDPKIHDSVIPDQKIPDASIPCSEEPKTPESVKDDIELQDLIKRVHNLEKFLNQNPREITNRKIKELKINDQKINLIRTNEAIIEVLKESKKELHLNDIFSKIKELPLKNPNVSLDTVRTTLYNLLRQKRVQSGKKALCFKIKEGT